MELPWDTAMLGYKERGASPVEARVAASSQQPSFCKLLWPSHPLQPWLNCSLLLVSLRADRLIRTPCWSLFWCFWRWGWQLGAASSLLPLASFLHGSSSGMFFETVFSVWSLSVIFLLLHPQVMGAFYPKHPSGVPLGSVDSLLGPSREGTDSRSIERMTIWINKPPASSQVCPDDQ